MTYSFIIYRDNGLFNLKLLVIKCVYLFTYLLVKQLKSTLKLILFYYQHYSRVYN